MIPTRRLSQGYRRREYGREEEVSNQRSGEVESNEQPWERFLKDALGGALRGMFKEMYEFWRRYRIR